MEIKPDHILRYLKGGLTAEEVDLFQTQLSVDPELRAEVEEYELFLSAFLEQETETEELSEKESQIEEKKRQIERWEVEENEIFIVETSDKRKAEAKLEIQSNEKKLKVIFKRRFALVGMIALLLIAGVGGYYLMRSQNTLQLANNFYKPQKARRIQSGPTDNSYYLGLNAYVDEEYKNALGYFSQVSDKDTSFYAKSQYLSGHAYLNEEQTERNKDQYEKALRSFTIAFEFYDNLRMRMEKESGYSRITLNDIRWYRGLSFLGVGKRADGINIISQIISSEKDTSHQREAILLLDQLD